VCLVTSVVAHYRLPVIRGLSSVAGIELSLVTTRGGSWATARGASLEGLPKVRVLPPLVIGPEGARVVLFRGLRRTLDSLGTDVVIAEPRMGMASVLFEALWRGRADGGRRGLVWWMAGWRDSDRERWKVLLTDAARRTVLRRADAVACYGSRAASWAVSLGFPGDAVVVAQNAIDTADLERCVDALRSAKDTALTSGHGVSQSGLRMLFVGQIIARKRLDMILHSMAFGGEGCRRAVLRIVGDGPEEDALRGFGQDLGVEDRVQWCEGTTDPARLAEHLVWADLALNPHTGGLSLNTYMAAGLPVVCGEADGTEDDLVLGGVTGWRFSGRSWRDLARCIDEAVEDRSRLRTMGTAAREHLHRTATIDALVHRLAEAARLAASPHRSCASS